MSGPCFISEVIKIYECGPCFISEVIKIYEWYLFYLRGN